ncbi:MAG: hypothetical protein AAF211_19040, partial [Myxococcota bacterium]
ARRVVPEAGAVDDAQRRRPRGVIDGSGFRNNSAGGQGGGIYAEGADVTINSTELQYNSSDDGGAGLHVEDGALTMSRDWLYRNIGNGMAINAVDAVIDNTVIADHDAYGGDGIDVDGGSTASLTNLTIVDNVIPVDVDASSAALSCSILHSNNAPGQVSGGGSATFNIVKASTFANLGGTVGANTYASSFANPMFVAQTSANYRLLSTSPLLGDCVTNGTRPDLDGKAFDQTFFIDLGAYER